LSLGSNIGDRRAHLRKAIQMLQAHEQVTVIGVSSLYESEPEDLFPSLEPLRSKPQGRRQPNFYNMAVEVETSFTPRELLELCQFVESSLKRIRKIKGGPRTIDVDILLYDEVKVEDEHLQIPHPRMNKRAFVVIPLLEITPDAKFPSGELVRECLSSISVEGIRKIGKI